jgi:cysteine desulfurase family protein (TIGR01976 family)
MTFDIDRVRAQYPALREGFAHFEGAAGTLVAKGCADAIAAVTGSAVANKSTAFEPGRRALDIVDEAREAIADLVGGEPNGVVFAQSATALTYLVARTLALPADGPGWGPGDEVVVSRLDHDANVRPWLQAAARVGATVRWAEFDRETGVLGVDQYHELVNERTRLVAVTAASNAIGSRTKVAEIAEIAHAAGALVYVDGVHATPHVPVDVVQLGADFYVTSAYKWSGPHIAACVAAADQWERMRPEKLVPAPDEGPDRFEHGTISFELLAGVVGAVEHLAALGPAGATTRRTRVLESMRSAQVYESEIFTRLVTGLDEMPGVRQLPAPPFRCPTVSFRVADQHPAETAERLGAEGICVFSGDNYAYEYFAAMGLHERGGAVRASVYHYNTAEDVARLLDALKRVSPT